MEGVRQVQTQGGSPARLTGTLVAVQHKDDVPVAAVILNVSLREEERRWLGECVELGTATFANTLNELRMELVEAIMLQLNQVEELGFVEDFLRDHGVTRVSIQPKVGSTWEVREPVAV